MRALVGVGGVVGGGGGDGSVALANGAGDGVGDSGNCCKGYTACQVWHVG